MFEAYSFYVILAGIALVAIGFMWLVYRAFRTSFAWGAATLLILGAPVFLVRHRQQARKPTWLLILGLLIAVTPATLNLYNRYFPDLGPREKLVEGELHLTLTGWDRNDYAFLRMKSQVVVLQMANGDVTDETVEVLKGMDKLRELDLNGAQVSDRGLAVLAGLPALQDLRLSGTKISDQGFRDHLAGKESLMKLELEKTQVAEETARAWRAAKKGRKLLWEPADPPSN